ncbi:MAG: Extracellular serine protease [Candidatus Erwinia impunctatus]|nr:Extracellular serine protease [Culicoides impunctatus]
MPYKKTVLALQLSACLFLGSASATENRTLYATGLISGFSLLNSTAEGKNVLEENLAVSIAIINAASEKQRARAIYDNTISALVGSMSNGLLVADALGSTMSAIYAANNSVDAATYKATTFSKNLEAIFLQFNTLIQADSSFSKNYYANGSMDGNSAHPATGISLPEGGEFNIYDLAYQPLEANRNTVGNSRPVQVAPDKIVSFTANDFFGVPTNSATAILPTVTSYASFPSGHSAFGFASTLLFAEMIPERFQDFLLRGSEYGNSRITLGVHYALDVIGARIMTTYALAQILNNNPDYLGQNIKGIFGGTMTTSNDFQSLMAAAQQDVRALLEKGCGSTIAACIANEQAARRALAAQNKADYLYRMTYGLSAVGPTDLAPVVPVGAEVLLATRFPYLTATQRRDVLATTEIESGHALDDGSGWARLNLYAATDGYGAFNDDVVVTMDAAQGGFSAFDSWGNDISGSGSFTKAGSGTLELTGNSTFSGHTTVAGGTLLINGALSNSSVSIASGAMLGGNGSVGDLTLLAGASVSPGNSIGRLQVTRDVIFQPDSRYVVEINAQGESDQIASGGRATLNGGEVLVTAEDRGNLLQQHNVGSLVGQRYTLLTAQNGVYGGFDSATMDSLFLGTTLTNTAGQVSLQVDRNATRFAQVATTDNQRSVARAIENAGAGNALYESILDSSHTVQDARRAYQQLSGQIHSDMLSAQLNNSRLLRDTLNDRLRQRSGLAGNSQQKANEAGAWVQLIGAWDHASGTDNATGYQASNYGFLLRLDGEITEQSALGVATGYSHTSLNGGSNASGDSDNYHVALYGSQQIGDVALRAGSTSTWHRIDTTRHVNYGVQSDKLSDQYSARSQQVYAEAAYGIMLPGVRIEPFINLSYASVQNEGVRERGGAAAVRTDRQHTDAMFSVLGSRAEANVGIMTVRGELGWQHLYSATDRDAGMTFISSGTTFQVKSVPASRDGAVVKVWADLALNDRAKLSLDYAGVVTPHHQDNRVNLGMIWHF